MLTSLKVDKLFVVKLTLLNLMVILGANYVFIGVMDLARFRIWTDILMRVRQNWHFTISFSSTARSKYTGDHVTIDPRRQRWIAALMTTIFIWALAYKTVSCMLWPFSMRRLQDPRRQRWMALKVTIFIRALAYDMWWLLKAFLGAKVDKVLFLRKTLCCRASWN